ncbi:type VII secretion target [Actinoplanes sp. TFC3]|uniref:type VII secretion target n=1 Tax=Actinoplanes sp. TFC3 TaxID=1710355 RepID=UPI00082D6FCB|nr:type VII secretion target [Actinoplanes sp. TFC3]
MTSPFTVRPQEVAAHSTHVQAVADGVTAAADAGAVVRSGNEAYGQLCAFVPPMLNILQDTVINALRTTAARLNDTAGDLRDTAADYETTEWVRERVFHAIRNAL